MTAIVFNGSQVYLEFQDSDNEHIEDIHPTSLHQYQCKVSIQHRSDQSGTETYNGPMIVLNKTGI